MNKKNILDYTIEELSNLEIFTNEKNFRIKQIYEWLHKKLVSSFDEMSNISITLREKLSKDYFIGGIETEAHLISKLDSTEKFLFSLHDNNQIESVLMRYKHGNTVCISTQVGCRMGCKFCASTIDGLARNLTAGEMLAQIYNIQRISNQRVDNIVLMGQGEPLDNYDNVIKFLKMINTEFGLNISYRSITLSTCGIVPNIIRLSDENIPITLAISLHATNDELRKKTMPIANRYSINEILEAVEYYILKTKRRVSFEYALIEGINNSIEDAKALFELLKNKLVHVNLIPVNTIVERKYIRPDTKSVMEFCNYLEKNKIGVTVRREMGSDISGACGQLRRSYKKRENESDR